MLPCRNKAISTLIWIVITLLFLCGAAMLAGSLAPYSIVKSKIDSMAFGGSASIFDEVWYRQICNRLKITGVVAICGSLALFLARKRVALYLRELGHSAIRLIARARKYPFRRDFRENKAGYIALLILMILALLVRLSLLNQSLKYDETGSFLYYAARPFVVIASYYVTPNNHILHTILMRCSYLIFGSEPWAIRLPAYIFGVLCIPAAYAVARRISTRRAALLTAGLVASSSLLIEFSVNARGYTLMVFLFLCVLFLASYLQKNSSTFVWALLALCAALGFYTVPVMAYPFGIAVCWLFLSIIMQHDRVQRFHRLKEMFTALFVTGLLTAIFYMPVFIVSGWNAMTANRVVLPLSWSSLIKLWPNTAISLWQQLNRDIPPVLQILFVASVIICILFYKKINLLLIPAMVIPIPLLLIQKVAPSLRVWIFYAFIYTLAVSAGLDYLLSRYRSRPKKQRHGDAIYAIIVVALSTFLSIQSLSSGAISQSYETGSLEEAPEIVEMLAPLLREGDCVMAPPPSDSILSYYLMKKGLTDEFLWADPLLSKRVFVLVNESYSHTLYEILKDRGLGSRVCSIPRIRGSYRDATLYELVK